MLAISEAKYLCSSAATVSSTAEPSFRIWASRLRVHQSITEPSPDYDRLVGQTRRELDRLLFLGASHYRRAFDLMQPSSIAWAHVTLYYGSFYSAHALLGMFGVWALDDKKVLSVVNGTPGTQQFKTNAGYIRGAGSHKAFWDYFYRSVAALLPLVDATLRFALEPVSSDRHWLIKSRNTINYDTQAALALGTDHQQRFRPAALRSSLPGQVGMQLAVLEGLLAIAVGFARSVGLNSDALDGLAPSGSRSDKVKSLIFDAPPTSLGRQAKRACAL